MRLIDLQEARTRYYDPQKGEYIDYEIDAALTLYHGTTKRRAQTMQHIEPRIGTFLRAIYPRARMNPLVYAADEHHKNKVWSACRFATAEELQKDRHVVTVAEFISHSAVMVIKTDRDKFRQATRRDKPHRGVEKFDYIAQAPVVFDDILVDQQLVDFFGKSFLNAYLIYE